MHRLHRGLPCGAGAARHLRVHVRAAPVRAQPLDLLEAVAPVALCAAAVLAEVFRAGMLAIPKGQTEAALAIGLREGATKRIVVFPQAMRIVVPALVAQAVVVVKDTAFGYVVSYPELMQSGRVLVANTNDLVQTYLVITAIYVVVNLLISAFAQWLEKALNRRSGRGSVSLLARARRSAMQ
ncbi:ABC transporter permease subunit [Salana multivorans]